MISPPRQFSAQRNEHFLEARFFGVLKSLWRLDQCISNGQAVGDGFEKVGESLNTVPLTSGDFLASTQQLSNAARYHVAGELSAARYELNLLIRRVRGIARFVFCLENAAAGSSSASSPSSSFDY